MNIKESPNNENGVAIACAEGDKIVKVLIENVIDNGWVMRWNLLQPNGQFSYQNFWGNESLRQIDSALLKGRFISAIVIADSALKITVNNITICFPNPS